MKKTTRNVGFLEITICASLNVCEGKGIENIPPAARVGGQYVELYVDQQLKIE